MGKTRNDPLIKIKKSFDCQFLEEGPGLRYGHANIETIIDQETSFPIHSYWENKGLPDTKGEQEVLLFSCLEHHDEECLWAVWDRTVDNQVTGLGEALGFEK